MRIKVYTYGRQAAEIEPQFESREDNYNLEIEIDGWVYKIEESKDGRCLQVRTTEGAFKIDMGRCSANQLTIETVD